MKILCRKRKPADPKAMPIDWVHPMTPDAAWKYGPQVSAYNRPFNCAMPHITSQQRHNRHQNIDDPIRTSAAPGPLAWRSWGQLGALRQNKSDMK
jgi:hypothetical protein